MIDYLDIEYLSCIYRIYHSDRRHSLDSHQEIELVLTIDFVVSIPVYLSLLCLQCRFRRDILHPMIIF